MAQFEEIGVRAVVQGVGAYQSDLGKVESKTKGTADKLKSIGGGMMKAGKGLTLGATLPILAVGGASLKMAADFETAFTEVTTLFDLPKKQVDDLREGVLDLSTTMGLDAVETTKALYQAISAGVEPTKALEFLATNAQLAIGGVTDLETAVDLTTTVLNAFGLEVEDTARVSDILFTGVKLGKTTVEELGASLFQVAPAAAASGVGIDQVTAALATLTAGGTPTRVAATQLRQAMIELGKGGTKANKAFEEVAGVGFRQFIDEGGNLVGAMELIKQKADEDGVAVSDLFGSVEAGLAVQVLAGEGFDKLSESMDATANAAGASEEAFEKMDATAARDFAKLQANFKRILIELGTVLLPVLSDFIVAILPVVKFIGKLVEAFGKLPGPVKTIIIAIVAVIAALGPFLIILGAIFSAVGAILPIIAALGALLAGPLVASFVAVLIPLLPFIAAAVVLAAIAFLIIKNWDKIKGVFKRVGKELGKVVKFFEKMPKLVLKSIKKLMDMLKKNWKKIVTVMLAILFPPGAGLFLIITNFNKIKDFVERIFKAFASAVERIARDLVNSVIDFFEDLARDTVAIFKGLVDDVVGFFTALPGDIVSALGSLASDLASVAENAMGAFADRIEQGLENIVGFFEDLPGLVLGAIGDLASFFFDVGKDIIEALVAGLSSAPGGFMAVAKAIANALIGAVNMGLDVLADVVQEVKDLIDKIPGPNPAGNLLQELIDLLNEGLPSLQRGLFRVPGSGSQDNFPAALAPGEMVIPSGPAEILRRALGGRESNFMEALTDISRSPGVAMASAMAAPPAQLAVSAPINVTVNSQNWAEVRRIVHDEVDSALDTARFDTTRAGAELSAGIG